jgi:hypothetical protein
MKETRRVLKWKFGINFPIRIFQKMGVLKLKDLDTDSLGKRRLSDGIGQEGGSQGFKCMINRMHGANHF